MAYAARLRSQINLKDMSFLTNLAAALLVVIGYLVPVGGQIWRTTGWFALSGAVTNWLAIYMLFERVPGLYGSGIIPLKFQEFKSGIRNLIMKQFFTQENVSRFLAGRGGQKFEAHLLLEAIDFELLLDKLIAAVQSTPFGPMLGMFGGTDALKGTLREPFQHKMREAIVEIMQSERFGALISKVVAQDFEGDGWTAQIEKVVMARLEELTPTMVKEIIQDMIRSHLGWLVVWGGVFGALMGLVAALLS